MTQAPEQSMEPSQSRQSKRRGRGAAPPATRDTNYRQLRSPFTPMGVFSQDQVENIHATALKTLEELGMRVLLPEARAHFEKAGARVEDDMVYIGREIVEAALATCPKSILCKGASPHRDVTLELGSIVFLFRHNSGTFERTGSALASTGHRASLACLSAFRRRFFDACGNFGHKPAGRTTGPEPPGAELHGGRTN